MPSGIFKHARCVGVFALIASGLVMHCFILSGDVVFQVSYAPHEKFTVDQNGIDLIYTERIKLVDALLGFSYVHHHPHATR